MKKIIVILALIALLPSLALSAPSLGARLQGKILLATQDRGKTFYVHSDGKRYQITKDTALEIFRKLALGITDKDLAQIPVGSVGIAPEVAGVKVECPAPQVVTQTVEGGCEPITKYVTVYQDKVEYRDRIIDSCLGQATTTPADNIAPNITYQAPSAENGWKFIITTDEPTIKEQIIISTSSFASIDTTLKVKGSNIDEVSTAPTTYSIEPSPTLTIESQSYKDTDSLLPQYSGSTKLVPQQFFYWIRATDAAGNQSTIDWNPNNYYINWTVRYDN